MRRYSSKMWPQPGHFCRNYRPHLKPGLEKRKRMMEKISIDTSRFGKIEVDPKGVINLTEGLLGFPDQKRYVLLSFSDNGPFVWLQSLDDPELAFVLIDPSLVDPNYRIAVGKEILESLRVRDLNRCKVYAIVTLNRDPKQVTANLLGPVIINPDTNLGCQVVLMDTEYTTCHRILP
jgi:flagellar assembly factor FliW